LTHTYSVNEFINLTLIADLLMMYIISNLFRKNRISNLLSSDNTEVTLCKIRFNICESVNYTYLLFIGLTLLSKCLILVHHSIICFVFLRWPFPHPDMTFPAVIKFVCLVNFHLLFVIFYTWSFETSSWMQKYMSQLNNSCTFLYLLLQREETMSFWNWHC
jgi:hypothetical protein